MVNVSSLGIYNAKILSETLHRLSILNLLFISHPTLSIDLPRSRYKNISIFYVLLLVSQKIRCPLISLAIITIYDLYVFALSLILGFDKTLIFHGLSGFCLLTLRLYKRRRKLCIIDRAGSHIAHQKKLITDQSREFGFCFDNSYFILEKRMLKEYQEADMIVVPSEYCRQTFLQNGTPTEKIKVLVATANLKSLPSLAKQFSPNEVDYLFVGGVGAQKGLAYMLKAWEYLCRTNKVNSCKARLTIISTEIPRQLKEFLDLPGIIYYPKLSQDRLFEVYSSSHILCHPAVDDAFGFVVQEAMHFGLVPIISSNCGATDIIINNFNGIVIPPFNYIALAHAMSLLHSQPDRALAFSREAKKTISDMLSSDSYPSGLLQLYEKTLSLTFQNNSI